jgi:uncharacterized alpha-E superfamily protein
MANLLARAAENIFWLARYLERVENLARIIDVSETFARDHGGRNWLSVVQINADERPFFAKHATASAANVLAFYLLDADNPTSIQAAILAAHHNARALRPLISIEMWAQINVLAHRLRQMTARDIAAPKLSRLCGDIREACQAHTGIVEGTLYRDEAWCFYWLGKEIERADQTTRLLDIKYHLLLPRAGDVGSALDVSQWNAVLQAAACYQAFRRSQQVPMTPSVVAGFLLFGESYPRSVLCCVRQVAELLGQLQAHYRLSGVAAALERVNRMSAAMTDKSIDQIISMGLHEFIDWVQCQLGALAVDIARSFFADGVPAAERYNAAAFGSDPAAG